VDENVPQALSGWRPTVIIGAAGGYADTSTRSQSTVAVARDAQGNIINLDSAGTPFSVFSDQPRTTANVTATVTQPLYRGGRTTAGTRRAENQVYAQRARLLAVEQTVLLDGVRAYVSVVQNQEEVRLNENNVQVLVRQLQATNERFRVGEITRTDVAQAEARLAAARFQLEQSQGTLQASRATFVRVIGLAPASLVAPPAHPPAGAELAGSDPPRDRRQPRGGRGDVQRVGRAGQYRPAVRRAAAVAERSGAGLPHRQQPDARGRARPAPRSRRTCRCRCIRAVPSIPPCARRASRRSRRVSC
jgi:outer membrane protein TolC